VSDRYEKAIEGCVEKLRAGTLTEDDLRATLNSLVSSCDGGHDLLYLQADSMAIGAGVLGMFTVENGEIHEGPPDPGDWPYATVLDALKDGWRVLKFPDLAMFVDETKLYGPGVEFILEKQR